jgi:arginase
VEACGGATVTSDDVVLLGARDPDELSTWDELEGRGLVGPELGVRRVDALRDLGLAASGAEAAERLAGDTGGAGGTGPSGRFWLHLDVDVLDEAVFPATDYLMPGGLDLDELAALMRPLASSPALIGASIGCYNPEKDPGSSHGRELVALIAGTFGG